jgi:selenocysteine lyase/cysteine desulfurase
MRLREKGYLDCHQTTETESLWVRDTLPDNPLIYLDNASTWPKPESVYRFMIDFYRSTGGGRSVGGARVAR